MFQDEGSRAAETLQILSSTTLSGDVPPARSNPLALSLTDEQHKHHFPTENEVILMTLNFFRKTD